MAGGNSVKRGTLVVHNGINGVYLYGQTVDGREVFVAACGDGSEDDYMLASGYDPNGEGEMLAEAYGFTLVDG